MNISQINLIAASKHRKILAWDVIKLQLAAGHLSHKSRHMQDWPTISKGQGGQEIKTQ